MNGPFFLARSFDMRQFDGAMAAVVFNDDKGGILCRTGSLQKAEDIALAMNRWRMEKIEGAK